MVSAGTPVRLRGDDDVLGHGHVREQPDLLEHVADLAAQQVRLRLADDVAPDQLHRPLVEARSGR
jgi:hypothetical protein